MSLLLALLSEGLTDDVEDDNSQSPFVGPQDNAMSPSRSLYFVMEQMEAHDEDEEPAKGKRV